MNNVADTYAFVTLVMGKAHYIKGALAMAWSLRKTKTKHEIICMLTPDLCRYRSILGCVFNKVISVPYLQYETLVLKTKKQNEIYGDWKDISFTKWNCLKLPYKKVCLLDVDLIIQKNIDHLFDLNAPAGCFGNNWSSRVNYYGEIKYGEIVSESQLQKGFRNGYLVNGHCVVLEPSEESYNKFLEFMKSKQYIKTHHCLAMTDEYALVKFMLVFGKQWTQIGMTYNCIPWKGDIDNAYILHYFNKNKPWNSERNDWHDLVIWWNVWDEMCIKNPEINEKIKLLD